jgi:hypothetical protein
MPRSRCVFLPVSFLIFDHPIEYFRIEERELLPAVLYEPLTCKPPCRAILNPHWYVSSLFFIHSTDDASRSQTDIRGKLCIQAATTSKSLD